jgi:hypothetical protein
MAFCSTQPISIADKVPWRRYGRQDVILSVDAMNMTFPVTGFENVIDGESSSWTDSYSETSSVVLGSSDCDCDCDGDGDLPVIPSLRGSPENLTLTRRLTSSERPGSSGYSSKSKLHVHTPEIQSDLSSNIHRLSMVQSPTNASDTQSETPLKLVTIAKNNSSNIHAEVVSKAPMSDCKAGAGKETGT